MARRDAKTQRRREEKGEEGRKKRSKLDWSKVEKERRKNGSQRRKDAEAKRREEGGRMKIRKLKIRN